MLICVSPVSAVRAFLLMGALVPNYTAYMWVIWQYEGISNWPCVAAALTALMLFEAECAQLCNVPLPICHWYVFSVLSISMLANLNGRSVHREISAQVPDQRCTRPQLNACAPFTLSCPFCRWLERQFITKPTYVAEIAFSVDSSSLRDVSCPSTPFNLFHQAADTTYEGEVFNETYRCVRMFTFASPPW